MDVKPLTKKNNLIYEYIIYYFNKHKFPPRFQDIGDRFGMSRVAVKYHIDKLESLGFIENNGTGRGLKVLKYNNCPFCGE